MLETLALGRRRSLGEIGGDARFRVVLLLLFRVLVSVKARRVVTEGECGTVVA